MIDGLISLLFDGLSKVFSSTSHVSNPYTVTVEMHMVESSHTPKTPETQIKDLGAEMRELGNREQS